ncbi:hypothetical protein N7493_011655 [Penicillium malachiteum]|uniref:Uncharacterized protein n=1 Tax=Penicillium malachiteum TaxID=1324776 RepID=A0AAD6MPZ6_9EURO|nr:hypothetical protein N7493_011655 [Penicillium malachiteum]
MDCDDREDYTPLGYAADSLGPGNVTIIELLLNSSADLMPGTEAQTDQQETLLHLVVKHT